jgi:hypothetical protein
MRWKESGHDLFEILPRHLPEGTKKNHKRNDQDSCCVGWDSNWVLSEYDSRCLPLQHPIRSFLLPYFASFQTLNSCFRLFLICILSFCLPLHSFTSRKAHPLTYSVSERFSLRVDVIVTSNLDLRDHKTWITAWKPTVSQLNENSNRNARMINHEEIWNQHCENESCTQEWVSELERAYLFSSGSLSYTSNRNINSSLPRI